MKPRDRRFIQWQGQDFPEVTDDVIKSIRYAYQIDLINNPQLISYMENRFEDSKSLWETWSRLLFNVEEKPKCPTCGKPVRWIGKKTKLYTKYCCNACRAHNSETHRMLKEAAQRKWGYDSPYQSPEYKALWKEKTGYESINQDPEKLKKRHETMMKKYGTDKISELPEFLQKTKETNRRKWGCDWPIMNPIFHEKLQAILMERYGYTKAIDLPQCRKGKVLYDHQKRIDRLEEMGFQFLNHKDYIEYTVRCLKCGQEFTASRDELNLHYNSSDNRLCPGCYPGSERFSLKSNFEKEVIAYIIDLCIGVENIDANKKVGDYIPDIIIEKAKLIIECNGMYWHSLNFKDVEYHYKKREAYNAMGYDVLFIWEDSWKEHKEVVQTQIKHFLGLGEWEPIVFYEIRETPVSEILDWFKEYGFRPMDKEAAVCFMYYAEDKPGAGLLFDKDGNIITYGTDYTVNTPDIWFSMLWREYVKVYKKEGIAIVDRSLPDISEKFIIRNGLRVLNQKIELWKVEFKSHAVRKFNPESEDYYEICSPGAYVVELIEKQEKNS